MATCAIYRVLLAMEVLFVTMPAQGIVGMDFAVKLLDHVFVQLLVQNVLVPLVTMVINVNHRVTVSMVTVIRQEVVYVAQDGKVLPVIVHVLKVNMALIVGVPVPASMEYVIPRMGIVSVPLVIVELNAVNHVRVIHMALDA